MVEWAGSAYGGEWRFFGNHHRIRAKVATEGNYAQRSAVAQALH